MILEGDDPQTGQRKLRVGQPWKAGVIVWHQVATFKEIVLPPPLQFPNPPGRGKTLWLSIVLLAHIHCRDVYLT